MCSHVGLCHYLWLACVLSVSGCAGQSAPVSTMTPMQRQWADQLIAGFSPPSENVLPKEVRSVDEILRFFWARHPQLEVLEQYRYRGFLFLPLRLSAHQQRSQDENLLNVVLVDLTARKYQLVLAVKS